MNSNEDNTGDLAKHVQIPEKENAYLKDKINDTENRSWSSNLCFLNVFEQGEGRDMIAFLNQIILLLLGKENFLTVLVIEHTPVFSSSTDLLLDPPWFKFYISRTK